MTIRSITIRGEITEHELQRIVTVIREIDTVPGRLLTVQVDGGGTSKQEAREIIRRVFEQMPGRETSEIEEMSADRKMASAELLVASGGFCPDCVTPQFMIAGPRGGMNQNFACPKCGAEFNIAKHGDTTVWGERLSKLGKPNLRRLRSVYGITL